MLRGFISMVQVGTQRDLANELLQKQGMVRLSEFTRAGITAATISRMVANDEVIRLARGLYQLPNALLDTNHSLAEAAKRVPKGVICLVSSLAFHELTDQLPRAVWMAIGPKDWAPKGYAGGSRSACRTRRRGDRGQALLGSPLVKWLRR